MAICQIDNQSDFHPCSHFALNFAVVAQNIALGPVKAFVFRVRSC